MNEKITPEESSDLKRVGAQISCSNGKNLKQQLLALGDRELEEIRLDLQYVCDHLDPYQYLNPEKMDENEAELILKRRLKKIGLDQIKDPFELTNALIAALEDVIEEQIGRDRASTLRAQ